MFRNYINFGSAEPDSPPRRGGVAAPLRKCREATAAAQTGWSDRQTIDFAELTTPARQPAAVVPPLLCEEGNFPNPQIRTDS